MLGQDEKSEFDKEGHHISSEKGLKNAEEGKKTSKLEVGLE